MTPEQIADIKARADKALEADKAITGAHISHIKGATSIEVAKAVVTLKAAVQQDIPNLIAALEAAERERDKAEDERNSMFFSRENALAARVKAEMERDEFIAVIEDFEETVDAHKDRITAIEAERDALKERENITDELMASQYRAGAQAGWNAAQLDEPAASKAIASLTEFKKGDLHHVRAANARRALESSK